jgi:hypothetical protein
MNNKFLTILLIIALFLSGCIPNTQTENKDGLNENTENYCIDNNDNGVCDKNEVPAKVTSVETESKPLPAEFLELIEAQDRVKSYYYIKKMYEDGLESTSIKDKYEVFYKDGKMKQLFSSKIYYLNDGVFYDYNKHDNESEIKSNSMVKENSLLNELNNAQNIVIEDDDFVYES